MIFRKLLKHRYLGKGLFGQGHNSQGTLCPRDATSKKFRSGTHPSGTNKHCTIAAHRMYAVQGGDKSVRIASFKGRIFKGRSIQELLVWGHIVMVSYTYVLFLTG
jgi:hypothetical protein